MTPALAALVLFNTLVAEYRERFVPEARVFVGVQSGQADESGATAWTKCIPESGAFVIQLAGLARKPGNGQATFPSLGPHERIEFIAAHEVCHVVLHARVLCDGGYPQLPIARKREMEVEADRCAVESMVAKHEGTP